MAATTPDEAPLFFDEERAETVPSKRRAEEEPEKPWNRRYIGTFVLSGYSMTKGTNYLQHGERVQIQRKPKPKSLGTARRAQSKQRPDYVVRFSNVRGTYSALTQGSRSVAFLWMSPAGCRAYWMNVCVSLRGALSTALLF